MSEPRQQWTIVSADKRQFCRETVTVLVVRAVCSSPNAGVIGCRLSRTQSVFYCEVNQRAAILHVKFLHHATAVGVDGLARK
jgi:hypothetical protein